MGAIIALAVFGILFVGLLVASRRLPTRDTDTDDRPLRGIALGCATVFAFIFLGTLAANSIVTVPTKAYAPVTSFNKPTGATLSAGLHVIKPWQVAHSDYTAAIQTDDLIGGNKETDEGDGPGLNVFIVNNATATVDVSIRWRIKQDAVSELYSDYKEFSNVRRSLVTRYLRESMNEVFAGYNPMPATGSTDKPPHVPTFKELGDAATKKMREKVGDQIDVVGVIVQFIHHDGPTQAAINKYQAELANTQIAAQRALTAAEEKKANDILASSVSNSGVLTSKCLDMISSLAREDKAKDLPAFFPCFPVSGAAVPAK